VAIQTAVDFIDSFGLLRFARNDDFRRIFPQPAGQVGMTAAKPEASPAGAFQAPAGDAP